MLARLGESQALLAGVLRIRSDTDPPGPFFDRGRLGRGVGGVQGRRRRSRSDGSVWGKGSPRRFALDIARAAYDDLPNRGVPGRPWLAGLAAERPVVRQRDPFKGSRSPAAIMSLTCRYPASKITLFRTLARIRRELRRQLPFESSRYFPESADRNEMRPGERSGVAQRQYLFTRCGHSRGRAARDAVDEFVGYLNVGDRGPQLGRHGGARQNHDARVHGQVGRVRVAPAEERIDGVGDLDEDEVGRLLPDWPCGAGDQRSRRAGRGRYS